MFLESMEGRKHKESLKEIITHHDLKALEDDEKLMEKEYDINIDVYSCFLRNLTLPLKRFQIKLGIFETNTSDLSSLLKTIIPLFYRHLDGFEDSFRERVVLTLDGLLIARNKICHTNILMGSKYWPIYLDLLEGLLTVLKEHSYKEKVREKFDLMEKNMASQTPYQRFNSLLLILENQEKDI